MWTEETIDRESQQKLYVQLHNIIKSKIEKGEWPIGTNIPSEDELCKIFDVSKATVRLAISELVRNGYLKRQQGKGTFVTQVISHVGLAVKTRLTEDMFGEGVKVEKKLLASSIKEPSEEIKSYLMTIDNTYYILCKGIVSGEPVYIEEMFVPVTVIPGIENDDICQTSFYDMIQEKAIKRIFKVIQTIEVNEIKGDVADMLEMKEGSPALLIHRILVGSDGSPIAYKRLVGSGGKYKFQTEFEKIK
jgi:GntR family transcriptional regulator